MSTATAIFRRRISSFIASDLQIPLRSSLGTLRRIVNRHCQQGACIRTRWSPICPNRPGDRYRGPAPSPGCAGGQGGGATGGGRLTASSRSEEVGSTGGDQSPLSFNWLLVNSAAMLGFGPTPGARSVGAAATVAGAAGAPEVKALMMVVIVCWMRGSGGCVMNEVRHKIMKG